MHLVPRVGPRLVKSKKGGVSGAVAPGLEIGEIAIKTGSTGAKALVRDPRKRMSTKTPFGTL